MLKSQSQWSGCVLAESKHLKMFNGGLVCFSMCLGVPFIAPRQLGAIRSPLGRQFLLSVGWRTGQSGAPPDMNSARFLSFFGEADRWALSPLGTPYTVRCTPDSPVWPSDHWLWPHVARWSRSRPLVRTLLAHRTVRWILAAAPSVIPESSEFVAEQPVCPVHPQVVLCWLFQLYSFWTWLSRVPGT
jgi:hypothetical protein